MKKILTACGLFLLFTGLSTTLLAQQRQFTGTVLNSDGAPVKFATIQVVGTKTGISADEQGKFKITAIRGQQLQISAVGYDASTVTLGDNTTLLIKLVSSGNNMGEVVVTALGISRAKKTLGYAVQELNNSSLTDAADNNIVNTISGKIAGAQVTSGGSTIGSSSRIVIRGEKSFSGNQPLFVVDGTPIDNTTTNLNGGGGVDWGNAAADLDPNDIESMTVLKGANAAALYGSRATNGVILITTKKASKGRKIGVDFNSSIVANVPGYWPKYQNEYGGGWDGEEYIWKRDHPSMTYQDYAKQYSYNYVDGAGGGVNDANPINWGPRLDVGLKLDQWSTGPNSPWISRPNNYKEFYSTEVTTVNNISVSASGDKASGRFSFTNENTPQGILPNTDQKQNTLNASFTLNPTDKLSLTGNLTYLVKHSNNIPVDGYTGVGVDFAWTEREFDTKYLKQQFYQHGNVSMWPGVDNYFYYYRNNNSLDRDRVFGNMNATYKITSWLSAMVRGGVDSYRERRKSITQSGTAANVRKQRGGQFTQTDIFLQEQNYDFILNFDKTFGDIRIDGLAGGNYRDNTYNSTTLGASDLTVPDLYTISNVKGTPTASMFDSHKRTNSVFAEANASYKDYLFLGITGRNDWSSTLPSNNRSYFYPSVSLGFDVTKGLKINSDILSYAKLRASWAKVGGDTDPYQLAGTYSASSFNGVSVFTPGATLPPTNLKPQETRSYEIGTNLRFLKNKLSLDVTYYDQKTVNQIISVATSRTTGYSGELLNAGEVENKGVEIMFDGKVLQNKSGLNWDISVNWAKNNDVVNTLYGGLQSYQISPGFGGATSLAIPGQKWGILWGLPFVRDAKSGKIVVDNTGIPLTTNVAKNFGTVTPDWIGGINNSFQYKNFNLSFLVDMRKGGKFFSVTAWHSYPTGSYTVTTANHVRENGMIVDAVKQDGTPNDVRVSAEDYFGGAWVWNNHEYSILDGSFIKLREVVFGYNLSVKKIPWLTKLNLSVFARNLAILYQDKSTRQFGLDPEVGLGGGDYGVGFENFQIPTTRNFGFKISAGF
ncbi:MAG TPA: SusC/RagA family TonB-linked outer membrane protein [Chitinophagaceae bacterium]|nr:SusC/RagA family TonB-linked outer membrane protein [Chitinophagaceae bacterium]